MNKHSVVDLFCGAGGLSYGLQQAGLNLLAGVDIDENCGYPFEENTGRKFYCKDMLSEEPDFVSDLFPDQSVRVLAGCAPCQPFSAHNKGRAPSYEQWGLLSKFAEVIVCNKPELVAMENVPRLPTHGLFGDFVDALKQCGYQVCWNVVQCADYGVPQNRNRLVLLASLLGPISLEPPLMCQPRTVRDTISVLPSLSHGEIDPVDRLHRCRSLSDLNLQRIRASLPGGSWRDWAPSLVLDCHAKPTGATYGSVYGRMRWDATSPTITTQFTTYGTGRFGHPEQDRALSLREGAMLQTFPQSYRFVPDDQPVRISSVAKLIGNAVPVELGAVIGRSLRWHMSSAEQKL